MSDASRPLPIRTMPSIGASRVGSTSHHVPSRYTLPVNSGHVLEMPPRRDFRVLRGTRVLAQCGCSGLLGVLDHRQHVSRVGISSRLHGTYGNFACLDEPWVTK
jgi:hypothetical protein